MSDGRLWNMVSSSDVRALRVVDGLDQFELYGPHYSRRTPGSKTFTGVGQEIVMLTVDETAVWAVVRQKTPARVGSGSSRGRTGVTDKASKYIWRNMLFRNLGETLSSTLVRQAVALTYIEWKKRYGVLPNEVMRTEIGVSQVRSRNPGYCYKVAGFHNARTVRGKVYLDAPCPTRVFDGGCDCCHKSSWTLANTDDVSQLLLDLGLSDPRTE